MKTVSVLESRQNARQVIRWALQGKRMVMTYRGRPVMRLEPVVQGRADADDSFLQLKGIVEGRREKLSNRDMDKRIYGG